MLRPVFFSLLISGFFIFSCGESSESTETNGQNKTEEKADKNNEETAEKPEGFHVYDAPKLTLNEFPKMTGDVYKEFKWHDKNGDNYLIFTKKESIKKASEGPDATSKELHAYHFKESGTAKVLVREIKDFVFDCIFDNRLVLIDESINITDLDDNGYGEVSFMYKLGCRSDVTPLDMKLMLLENGDKYAIRGTEIVQIGPNDKIGGETNPDATLNKHPEFKKFAMQTWTNFGGGTESSKPKKTLLNAENLAGYWYMKPGKHQDTRSLPPSAFEFKTDGTLRYTIMEEDWLTTEWDMKSYPTIIVDKNRLPGRLTFEEGVVYYYAAGQNGGEVIFIYQRK